MCERGDENSLAKSSGLNICVTWNRNEDDECRMERTRGTRAYLEVKVEMEVEVEGRDGGGAV